MAEKLGRRIELREGWRDNVQPFISAKVGAAKIPTFGVLAGGVGSYQFSPTAEQELFIYFHINHDYELGTALFPHVHWSPSTTNTGVVRWGMEFITARGHNQEVFSAPQTIYFEEAAPGIALQHMVTELAEPGLLIPKLEPDSVILCRIFRDATHVNDTYPDSVFGFMADLHYYSDHYTTINKKPQFDR